MFLVQVYLFIAIPCWLLGVRKTGSRRERTTQSVTTGVLSGVAVDAGVPAEPDRLVAARLGALWIVGGALLAIGAVLHVTASSSVRVVKLSLRLRPNDRAPASGRIDDAGGAG